MILLNVLNAMLSSLIIQKTVDSVRREDIEDEKGNFVVPTKTFSESSSGPVEIVSPISSTYANTTAESSPRGEVYLKDNGSKF